MVVNTGENPFRHIRFGIDIDGAYLECAECGGGWQTRFPLYAPIADLVRAQTSHFEVIHQQDKDAWAEST